MKTKREKLWVATLYQGGMVVASVTGLVKEDVTKEIQHYSAVYSQDGPCEIKITRSPNG